jgi:hypothetical protein
LNTGAITTQVPNGKILIKQGIMPAVSRTYLGVAVAVRAIIGTP